MVADTTWKSVSLKVLLIIISLLLQKSAVPLIAGFSPTQVWRPATLHIQTLTDQKTTSPSETPKAEHPSRKSCLSAFEILFLINSVTVVQRPGMKQRSGSAQNPPVTDLKHANPVGSNEQLYSTSRVEWTSSAEAGNGSAS
jgi:hypothetical protein